MAPLPENPAVPLAGRDAFPDFLSGGGGMGALMRRTNWLATPLGSEENWPQSLRTSVSTCLNCAFPILIWWGPDLVKLYNDAYSLILGAKHPSALGRPGREVWPEIWDVIGPMLHQVMAEGIPTRASDLLLMLHRRGYAEECYFSFSYSPIRAETGGIGGVFCPVIETTERVIGERRLHVLRCLAELSGDLRTPAAACAAAASCLATEATHDLPFNALYLLSETGTVAHLAGSGGLTPDSPLVPADVALHSAGHLGAAFSEVARTGQAVILDASGGHLPDPPTGPWRTPPEAILVLPLGSGGGRPFGFMLAGLNPHRPIEEVKGFADLTASQIATVIAHARAYEEERRRAEALAEIDRAKTAFFSNISHEFRTPLSLMLAPIEDALNDQSLPLPAAQRERLDVAHRNSLRLLKLVNTLLDFSRIEAGRARASFQSTDLAAMTAELASGFRSAVERAGLFLEVDCPPLPAPVFIDRDMWEKVVLNLLSNAFKFTFEGGITVRLGAAEGRAVLSVRDTGVGIPEAELPRLFERFHRIDGQRSRSFEGSGIGLALVHELVRLHGGTIAASSTPGHGAEFSVTLPFGSAHLPRDQIGTPSSLASTATRVESFVEEALRWLPDIDMSGFERGVPVRTHDPAAMPGSARRRIIVADDNADMRGYIRRLLAEHYDVTAAADGEAALRSIQAERPDLVLADVMMPSLDGFGLLRAIRSDPMLRDLPVILLSARAGEEARAEGMDAGADDYLIKPFSARELLARVGAHIAMLRIRQEAQEALRARTTELEAVLEAVPAPVWFTHDRDARRAFGNRAAARLLRMESGENASLSSAKPPTHFRAYSQGNEVPTAQLPLQRATRGEEVRDEELEVRFDDGSAVTLLVHALPIRGSGGGIVGAICAGMDITERKRTEIELDDSRARLQNLLATLNLASVFVRGLDGTIHFWSRGCERLYGWTEQEAVGRSAHDLLRTVYPAPVAEIEAQLLRHGEWAGDLVHQRRDGEQIIIAARKALRLDPNGQPAAVMESVADVTALRHAQAELRLLNEDLEVRVRAEVAAREATQAQLAQAEKMTALGQLAGGIAHDFNNVMQAVSGSAGLIRRRKDHPDAVDRLASMIEDAALRGSSITRRLLAFARRDELRAEAVDLTALLEGMREVLSHTLGPAVIVRVESRPELPLVLADRGQLETVLVNLATNARDAMPGGGTLIFSTSTETVTSAGHPEGLRPGEYVCIRVADTGTGMDTGLIARVMEPFFTTKERGKGTGLGLPMARSFAEQSNGALGLYSEPGRGTTVALWLPVTDMTEPTAQTVAPVRTTDTARLLLVDDEDLVREVLAAQLTEFGYGVVQAESAAKALALITAGESVDLLISDLSMPDMDGVTLIREVLRRRPRMPVVLLTGYAGEAAALAVSGAVSGLFSLLRKPVSGSQLADRVAVLLEAVSRS